MVFFSRKGSGKTRHGSEAHGAQPRHAPPPHLQQCLQRPARQHLALLTLLLLPCGGVTSSFKGKGKLAETRDFTQGLRPADRDRRTGMD